MSLSRLNNTYPVTLVNFASIIYVALEEEDDELEYLYTGQSRNTRNRIKHHFFYGTTTFDKYLRKPGVFERVRWYVRWRLLLSAEERTVYSPEQQASVLGICTFLMDENERQLIRENWNKPRRKNSSGGNEPPSVEHVITVVYRGLFRR